MLLEVINDWLDSRGFVCYINAAYSDDDLDILSIQGYMRHANITLRDAQVTLTEYDMSSGVSAKLTSVDFDLNEPKSLDDMIARLESFIYASHEEKSQNIC